jgi:opacity protein-like surface antigen
MMSTIAAPSFAQADRGYVTGIGGFAVTPDTTSGDVLGEVGVRVAPRLFVFGNVGQFHNLQPSDAQPAIDTTTAMSAAQGLNVIGTGRVPAWYSTGGVRYEVPTRMRVAPYVIGAMGVARLTPKLQFTYSSGQLPDGSVPVVGSDVTAQLVSAGDLTTLGDTNALMFTLGGGVQVPVAPRWMVDVGYRFSRVAADTPLNAQGATFGVGYRF